VADSARRHYRDGDDLVELLARHLYLGGAGEPAMEHLLRAADRAQGLFANDTASRHLANAVDVARALDDNGRLPDLLTRLASLDDVVGRYDDALGRWEEVSRLVRDGRAARGIAAVHRKQGDNASALRVLDEALASGDVMGDNAAALWLERGRALMYMSQFDDAAAALEGGLAVADPRGPIAGPLLAVLARTASGQGDPEAALRHGEAALAALDRHDDLRTRSNALRVVGVARFGLGDLDGAATATEASLQLAERIGDVEEAASCLVSLGLIDVERNDLERAIEWDRRAIVAFERIGHDPGRAVCYGNLADKLRRVERYAEAEQWVDAEEALAVEICDRASVAHAGLTRAWIRLGQGRREDAAALAERAAAEATAVGDRGTADEATELARTARVAG
jgi:tetratricopeptide (TPR) repeat protein